MGKLSKGRGYRWEKDVEKLLKGRRTWAGPGLDIEVPGFGPVECKERQNDSGLKTLVKWVEQAEKYTVGTNLPWGLLIKLGMGANALKLAVVDADTFADMLDELRELRERVGDAVHLPGGTDRGPEPEAGD